MSRPQTSWLVSEGESLVAVLGRLNQSAALVAGRVFVNGRRADADVSLEVGARVDVYAARGDAAAVSILAQHRGLVFAEKPVGLATEPERRGSEHTLLHRVAALLSVEPARVNALTRLDVGVSGVVLLALDAEARQSVQALRAAGAFERRYVALASAAPVPDAGSWNEAIGRGSRGPRRALDRNGEPAETRYLIAGKSASGEAVLAFRPLTGRTHQLRVHASAHGAPLLGDATYGASKRLVLGGGRVLALPRIYLHAAWMALGDALRVEAPLPEEFGSTWSALDGESAALERAVVDPLTL